MRTPHRFAIAWLLFNCLWLVAGLQYRAMAADAPAPASVAAGTAGPAAAPPAPDAPSAPVAPLPSATWDEDSGGGSSIVGFGHDVELAAGRRADTVVAIGGSATSNGRVDNAIVAILGDTLVTGTVGDSVVAVLGSDEVDAPVHGDVVAVLGNVHLGPHADVHGDVVSVGGSLTRDPAAIIHGSVQDLPIGPHGLVLGTGLRTWLTHCLMLGRLLAFTPAVAWAWTFALLTLAGYALTAVLFRAPVERCLRALTEQPGASLLAGVLAQLATPLLIGLLCITVVGLLAVPVVGAAVLIAEAFGRIAVLAWIGGRVLRPADPQGHAAWRHPAALVLVGGVLITLLYTIPVLGLIVYKLVGFFGLGAVAYALLTELRGARTAAAGPRPAPSATAPSATAPAAAESSPAQPEPPLAADPQPAPSPAPSTVSPAAAALPRASFWIRMAALLIDLLLVGAVLEWLLHVHHLHLVVLAGYGAVMWKLRGATVGGTICHLQVVRLDGRPMDWPTAVVRALGCFLSLLFAGLGFLWIAFDREHQAWHDKIAGTVVVRTPNGAPLV